MTFDDFASVAAFHERVGEAIDEAAARRCRQLTLVDPDFAAWPLERPAVIAALTRFIQLPERRVVLVGLRFDAVQREQPRFVRWRRTYAHAVHALAPVDESCELPTVLLADRGLGLRVLERLHWRGRVVTDPRALAVLADEVDAFAQRCQPVFAATTLGL
jgi:hypothetical protein